MSNPQIVTIILGIITMINIFFIVFIVLYERKSPVTAIAWILTLTFIPVIGFIFYILFGGRKHFKLGRIFKVKQKYDEYFKNKLIKYLFFVKETAETFNDESAMQYKDIIQLHFNNSNSVYTQDNSIKIYIDAGEKYKNLLKDINEARQYINVSYFIIRNDKVGKRIVGALTRKAKEGVKVKLLYDDVGSVFTPFRMFKELIQSGGIVQKFLPSKLGLININANYRYHRKIVIIDGKTGYLGGMNIGEEYMGLHKRVKPWRDTHLRINGSSVYMLQLRFLMDWAYASKETNDDLEDEFLKNSFPIIQRKGNIGMQIVSSGPDTGKEEIKTGLIKLINSAKSNIYIQTPYFIPDSAFLEALKIASMSGVEVKVMLPGIADKRFVFHGTNSYIQDLLDLGAKVYMYNGFMHSKLLIMDDKIVSMGTTNIDIRSFALDFEINAFIYNTEFAQKNISIFEDDEKKCRLITREWYDSRNWQVKVKEAIFRLLSPVL